MMKKYEDITVLKAFACFSVFITHWLGAFGSWGSRKVNALMEWGPFPIITYGSFALCVFLMISGMLMAQKVFRGRFSSWGQEVGKRYLRLLLPIFMTSLLAMLLFKGGLFYTQQAAACQGNEWLAGYYAALPGWLELIRESLYGTLAEGVSFFYGPLWMLKYTFFGGFLSVILAKMFQEMTPAGCAAVSVLLGVIFTWADVYYLCFLLGTLLAMLLERLEQLRAAGPLTSSCRLRAAAAGAVLLIGGGILLRKSFVLAAVLSQGGFGYAFGDALFTSVVVAFVYILAFRLLWMAGLEGRGGILRRALLWMGTYSLEIYLTHWLVISSFSCWFYSRFYGQTEKLSIGLNMLLSLAIIFLVSRLYYFVVDGVAYRALWDLAGSRFFRKQ